MEVEYLLLGYIIGPFGLDGTIKVYSKTNLTDIRYKKGNQVFIIDKEGNRSIHEIANYRKTGNIDFVKLLDINSIDEAEKLKGCSIEVVKNSNDLKEGQYFFSDLLDLDVYDENENLVGKIVEVMELPAHINLLMKSTKKKNVQIPFVKEFVRKVDIKEKRIYIHFIDGML